MVVGDVLDKALEQYGVVTGLERVGDVMQVDFELGRGAFLDDGVGRNALLLGAFEDVLQAIGILVRSSIRYTWVDCGRLPEIGERGGWGRPFTFSWSIR